MKQPYTSLSAVLERLGDQFPVKRDDVVSRVLVRNIWISGAGQPGCLYDSGPDYHASKKAAVEHLVWCADMGEGAPRGMRAALLRYGSYTHDGVRYEISRDTLQSVLS